MIKLQFYDGNNNIDFIKKVINVISKEQKNMYWAVGDLEIIPRYPGDYPGSGVSEYEEIAWELSKKVEREKWFF